MAVRTRVVVGLVPTLFSGFGTYELLRKGEGHSLSQTNKKVAKEESGAEGADNGVLGENDGREVENETPKLESRNLSYKQVLLSKSPHLEIIGDGTPSDVVKNIILHRMFPHFRGVFTFERDKMFDGSPKMTLQGEVRTHNNKKLYILGKNTESDVKNLKDACGAALEKPQKQVQDNGEDPQIYRLKAWCTIPTIRDVLQRHRFEILKQDGEWRQILESEWITQDDNHGKQSLLTKDDLKKIKETTDEKAKISILKNRCNAVLDKKFTRGNFPATKDFLGDGGEADEFQEAALLCTVPTTAANYIKNAMKGVANKAIPQEYGEDYCYDANKSVGEYGETKTTDPAGGKSF